MANNRRIRLNFRLEDAAALAFFIVFLAVEIIFSEVRGEGAKPADVLVIVPAVALLLAKEVIHYFVAGEETRVESTEDIRKFVRPYWNILRDWFPFLIILMMYYSLWGAATHLLVTHDRDAALLAWDRRLFGCEPSVALQHVISPLLTAWMEFAYSFHLYNIPIVACFIYICRPRQRFREMMFGLVLITLLGLIGYILVPAVGPLYALRNQYTVPLTQPLAIFSRQIDFMDYARISRDVFPSLHVGISFVVWLYAWRNSKALFWILSPFILSLWFSTVYLRYHYLIDCVVGFILAPLAYFVANWLFARFGEVSVTIPFPNRWLRPPVPVQAQESSPGEPL
ncbi:MAG TPA: phosphatase PAP2 family protein [Terriglobia bacterium]|nr:phosphatase PAP2 family protein [Terriglobia bacterium]